MSPDDYSRYFSPKFGDLDIFPIVLENSAETIYDRFYTQKFLEIIETTNSVTPLIVLKENIRKIDATCELLKKEQKGPYNDLQGRIQKRINEILGIPDPSEMAAAGASAVPDFVKGLPAVDGRLLIHLHGDAFAKGTKLEGAPSSIPINYLKNFLEKKEGRFPGLSNAIKTLRSSQEVAAKIESITKKLDSQGTSKYVEPEQLDILKNGAEELKALLLRTLDKEGVLGIPGGWAGTPGHAVFFEIVKEAEGKLTVRIYNTGSGLDEKESQLINNKFKNPCFQQLNHVDAQDLFNSSFLETLLELEWHRPDEKSNDENDFNAFISLIKGERQEADFVIEDLMSPQRSGTCTWKSLCAFMRRNLSHDEYKRFKYEIKLQSLVDFFTDYTNKIRKYGSTSSHDDFILLRECIEKFARSILKLRGKDEKSIISNDEFAWVNSWLTQSTETLKKIDILFHKEWADAAAEVIEDDVPTFMCSDCKIDVVKADEFIPPKDAPFKAELLADLDSLSFTAENTLPILTDFLHLYKDSYQDGRYYKEMIYSIQNLLMKLPSPVEDAPFYTSFSQPQSLELMQKLNEMNEILFKASFSQDESNWGREKSSLVSFKVLAIMPILMQQADPQMETLLSSADKEYGKLNLKRGFSSNVFDRVEKREVRSLFFQFRDPILSDAFMKISDSLARQEKIYSIYQLFNYGLSTAIEAEHQYGTGIEDKILLKLLENPIFLRSVNEKDPDFSAISDVKERIKYLMTHDRLLPESFKVLRQQTLISKFFIRGNFAKPSSFQRTPQSFKIQHNKQPEDRDFSTKIRDVEVLDDEGTVLIEEARELTYFSFSEKLKKAQFLHENLCRKLQNTKLKDLFVMLPSDENDLLTLNLVESKAALPREEALKLLAPLVEKKLQAALALSYFDQNQNLLNDSDYQTLFQLYMFENDALLLELRSNPDFVKELEAFVEKGYANAIEYGKVEAALFFLNLSRHFKAYQEYVTKVPFQGFLDEKKALDLISSKFVLKESEKLAFHIERAAHFIHLDKIDEKESIDLIASKIYITKSVHDNSVADPKIVLEADQSLYKFSSSLKEILKENPSRILNQVLEDLEMGEKKEWREIDFPIFESLDGLYKINVVTGSLAFNGASAIALPDHIIHDSNFRYLFGDKVKFAFFVKEGSYTFEEAGVQFRIFIDAKAGLIIQKNTEGKWLQFIPKNKLNDDRYFILGNKALITFYDHWMDVDNANQIAIINPKSGKLKYIVEISGTNINSIHSAHDPNEELVRLTRKELAYEKQLCANINNFEDLLYVNMWEKDRHLTKIELSRYSLNFIADYTSGSLVLQSKEFKGFHLAKQYLDSLGTFNHFLLLENDQGEKRVLIPKKRLTQPGNFPLLKNEEILFKDINYSSFEGDARYREFASYKVGAKNTLKPETLKDAFFLSLVLLSRLDYKNSFSLLEEKNRRYTPEERELLLEIVKRSNSGCGEDANNFPGALAVRLRAAYLLFQNEDHFGSNGSEIEKNDFATDVGEYIKQLNNVTTPALTRAEEIYLCNKAVQYKGNAPLLQRLIQLVPELTPLPETTLIEYAETKKINYQMAKGAHRELKNFSTPEPLFRVRMETSFGSYFEEFYNRARSFESSDKKDIEERIPFLLNSNATRVYGVLLSYALKFPELCPDYTELIREDNFVRIASEAQTRLATEKKTGFLKVHPPEKEKAVAHMFLPLMEETQSIQKEVRGPALIGKYFTPEAAQVDQKETSQDLIKSFRAATASSDKIYKQEIIKLEQDCLGAQKLAALVPPQFKLTRALDDLEAELQGLYEVDLAKATDALGKCLEIANRKPTDQDELILHEVKLHGKILEPLTGEDLILFIIKQDMGFLKERNPLLTEEDALAIRRGMKEYLIHATNAQKWLRALKIEKELENAPRDSLQHQELTQELAERIKAERHYDADIHPQYLAFEYYADILMRKSQVETLEKFLNGEDNTILQMIMGGGKTKVLLPILAFMKANGTNLSMIIVPESLYEQCAEDMRITSHGAFSQSVHALNFDRNTEFTPQKLSGILKELKNIEASREALVMTSKSVLCLYLKYLEACHAYSEQKNPEMAQKVHLMRGILSHFKDKAQVIADEADLILNCRREVNFTFGSPEGLKAARAESVSELYEILLESVEIRKKVKFDFATQNEETAQPFTLDLYENEIKPILVNIWLEKHPEFLTYKEYLLGKAEAIPTKDQDINDLLALVKEEINILLPLTLKKNYAEHYGISENEHERLAVPYLASNTPSKGSQFGNTYELMNYTLQMYLRNGVSTSLVKEAITQLQGRALEELKSGKHLEETESDKNFRLLVGPESKLHLLRMNEADIEHLQQQINGTLSEKIKFIKRYILPHIKVFDHKLSGNAQNLVSLFARVQGFTGTLWNSQSYHSTLKPVSELGTDVKTLSILWENSKDKVHISQSISPLEILTEIFEKSELKEMQAIIDTGGSFKGFTNEEVAKAILEKTSSRGVVYYNAENVLVILEKGAKGPKLLRESELSEKERITFYDQRHTTGSDIPQAPFAKAVVTIGKATFLRDLLQSVWRMRRLDKGQRIEFLIPNEIHKLICLARGKNVNSLIDFEDIMHFCIQNQAQQIGEDNVVSLKQKMKECLQEVILKHVPPEDVFKVAEKLFLQDTSDSPFESFGKPQETISGTEAAERELTKSIRELEKLITLYPLINSERDVTTKKLQSLVIEESLPSFTLSPGTTNYEQSVEVEQEQEKEMEQEKEIETAATEQRIKPLITWLTDYNRQVVLSNKNFKSKPLKETISTFTEGDRIAPFTVNEGLAMHPEFIKYQDVFSSNLLTTANLLFVNELKATSSPVKPFDFYQKKVNAFVVLFDTKEGYFKVILADQNEVASLREGIIHQTKPTERFDIWIYQPELNLSLQSTTQSPLELNNPSLQRLLVEAKFFNGELNYSPSELEILRVFIQEKGVALMEELFVNNIIKNREVSRSAYDDSPIKYLFDKLKF